MDPLTHPPQPDASQPSGLPQPAPGTEPAYNRPLAVPARDTSFGLGTPRRQTSSLPGTAPTPQTPALPPKPTISQDVMAPPPSIPKEPEARPPQPPPATPTPQPAAPRPQPPTPVQADPQLMHRAAVNDRKRSVARAFKSFLSLVSFGATVVIVAMLINHFVFQSYYVDGSSMVPTLENEDRLIIDKVGKTIANVQGKPYLPARGDIVVLDSAILDRYGHNEQLIKRVVGLPGDTVIIREGTVTIKNSENPTGFDLDKQLGLQVEPTYSEAPIEIKVPENSVYVLGDNRGLNGSFDSRAFGPTAASNIQGRLSARIFPFDRAKAF